MFLLKIERLLGRSSVKKKSVLRCFRGKRWFRSVRNNMKTTKTIGLLSFGLLFSIFLISVINAQTLIAGKIYTSNYDNLVSGADVSVTCNLYPLTTNSNPLITNSLEDGTYAVRFEENICNNTGDSVQVNSIKAGLSGSGTGVVVECDGSNDCDSGLFSIVNLAIKPQSNNNNNGGSSGGYYFCGNNRCDSGETINTYPKDCKLTQNQTTTTTTTNTTNTETTNENTNTEETGGETTPPENQTRVSRITGAVTGVLGNFGLLIIIIFILVIIGLSISVRLIRKRKQNIEEI
jgi:hypothetical protein